jgi:hypothetical protein
VIGISKAAMPIPEIGIDSILTALMVGIIGVVDGGEKGGQFGG